MSAIAIRERSVTLFFLLAVILAGVIAYVDLGRAEDPHFAIKVFTVAAAWPGATAQEMQDLVAEPLEKRMQELTYYDHVDTFTRPGLAFLTVQLKDYTTPRVVPDEVYQGRKKIQDEASRLPQGVLTPVLLSPMCLQAWAPPCGSRHSLIPVGFAASSAGEYAGNIFWIVCIALLTSWVVAVTFAPYLGVIRFVLDQDRLCFIGLSSNDAADSAKAQLAGAQAQLAAAQAQEKIARNQGD